MASVFASCEEPLITRQSESRPRRYTCRRWRPWCRGRFDSYVDAVVGGIDHGGLVAFGADLDADVGHVVGNPAEEH